MKNVWALLAVPLLLVACSGSERPGSEAGDSATTPSAASDTSTSTFAPATADTSAPATEVPTGGGAKLYDVESGVLAMRTSMATGQQMIYFEDYGRRQAIYIDMDIMGKRMQTAQITTDGWLYSFDMQTKTGQKMREPKGGMPTSPDPDVLSEEKKKEFKYRELESRELLGRQADGFSMEVSQGAGSPPMVMRTWRWKKVPLRMEMDVPGMPPVITEVMKAQFDIGIAPDRFIIPPDVKLEEKSASVPATRGVPNPTQKPVTP